MPALYLTLILLRNTPKRDWPPNCGPLAVPVGVTEAQAKEAKWLAFASNGERLWKEHSAAMHQYLGLSRPVNAARDFRYRRAGPVSVIGPETESQPALAAIRERILRHEYVAHPEATWLRLQVRVHSPEECFPPPPGRRKIGQVRVAWQPQQFPRRRCS
jgi:hypothetical protein